MLVYKRGVCDYQLSLELTIIQKPRSWHSNPDPNESQNPQESQTNGSATTKAHPEILRP